MKRLSLWVSLCFSFCLHATEVPPGYAVASASRYATEVGMSILAQGGNAFDAAVAVTAVLAVTEPYHSGLGGGGFWLLHDQKKNDDVIVDGREVAPKASTATMYLNDKGHLIKELSLYGPLAAAIPGEPAALVYIAKHYGKLSLKQTLAPAIQLAKQGFRVDEFYRRAADNPRVLSHLKKYHRTAKQFLYKGKVPPAGYVLKQPDLAITLEHIAAKGRAGFYQGEVATALVRSVRKYGGIWQSSDLKNYQLKIRKPLVGHYKGIKITTMPPPSAGGLSLLTMLDILDHYPLSMMSSAYQIHTTVEAMRLAFWDRRLYLGDPDFVKIPIQKLRSNEHIHRLMKFIKKDTATSSTSLQKKVQDLDESDGNTTHFSIIDSEGNRVAATLSINFLFGSSFVAGPTGVLLNDEMNDFAVKPGEKNVFGLVGGDANKIEPGKRPLSSMMPTFLEDKERVAILGTPGGSRIPTMVLLSTLAFEQGATPIHFVSLPRYHHQYMPDEIQFEFDAISPRTQAELRTMGYRLNPLSSVYGGRGYFYGDMQAIQWNKLSGGILAASDPRKVGLAEVHYNPR